MIADSMKTDTGHGLDFLSDPVLVVTVDGQVVETNAAAKALFGAKLGSGALADLLADDPEDCMRFLRNASSTTAPRPGKLAFHTESGPQRFMLQAARSKQDNPTARIILRLLQQRGNRFAMLDRRVKALDAELHDKLQKNAALHEALRQKQVLLRELQHRVKNNIQLIMSLTKISSSGYDTPEVSEVVGTLRGRLQAMAAAQEALYQADEVETVMARAFLEGVVRTAARATGAAHAVSFALDDAELSSNEAHSLALIANELITNAAKYGLRDGEGHIRVTFANAGGDYRFEVADNGSGISEKAASRSSGLALVRGLCRQIGGRLDIDGDDGTICTVRFRADSKEKGNE
ncbi:MAG: sensor histidine kinase [Rhodobacterales bacterium]